MPRAGVSYQNIAEDPGGNWNVAPSASVTNTGVIIASLIDFDSGLATGWGLEHTGAFDSNNVGMTGWTGVTFPQLAIDGTWNNNTGATSVVRWTGLNNAETYDIELAASRLLAGANRNTRYVIGATTIDVDASENQTVIAAFTNVSPVSGNIDLTVSGVAGTDFSYLNASLITENSTAPQAPPTQHTPIPDQTIGVGDFFRLRCMDFFDQYTDSFTLRQQITFTATGLPFGWIITPEGFIEGVVTSTNLTNSPHSIDTFASVPLGTSTTDDTFVVTVQAGHTNSRENKVKTICFNTLTATGNLADVGLVDSSILFTHSTAPNKTLRLAWDGRHGDLEDEVLVDSPVFYIRMDETSGNTATNIGSDIEDAFYNGGFTLDQATEDTECFGRSVLFDGITGRVGNAINDTITSPGTSNPSFDYTLRFLINLQGVPTSNDAVIELSDRDPAGANNRRIDVIRNASNELEIRVGRPTNRFTQNSSALVVGTWYHVIIELDIQDATNTNDMRIYLKEVADVGDAPLDVSSGAGTHAAIDGTGLAFGGAAFFFSGPEIETNQNNVLLDEVSIHESILGATRRAAHFTACDTTAYKAKFRARIGETGLWNYSVTSTDTDLNGQVGSFTVDAALGSDMEKELIPNGQYIEDQTGEVVQLTTVGANFDIIRENELDELIVIVADRGSSRESLDFFLANGFEAIFPTALVWEDLVPPNITQKTYTTIGEVFDLDYWKRIDRIYEYFMENGGAIRQWLFTDDDNAPTTVDIGWDTDGTATSLTVMDTRLIDYALARFGAYPGFFIDAGVDVPEYRVDTDWVEDYATHIALNPYYDIGLWAGSRHGLQTGGIQPADANYYVDDFRDRPTRAHQVNIFENDVNAGEPVMPLRPGVNMDRWDEGSTGPDPEWPLHQLRYILWELMLQQFVGFAAGDEDSVSMGDFSGYISINTQDFDHAAYNLIANTFKSTKITGDKKLLLADDTLLAATGNGALAHSGSIQYIAWVEDGQTFSVDLTGEPASPYDAEWFNPRDGSTVAESSTTGGAIRNFTSPTAIVGDDWTLILNLVLSVTPNPIEYGLEFISPTIVLGDITITPTPIEYGLDYSNVDVSLGNISVTPAPVEVGLEFNTPTIIVGGNTTITPVPINIGLEFINPVVTISTPGIGRGCC